MKQPKEWCDKIWFLPLVVLAVILYIVHGTMWLFTLGRFSLLHWLGDYMD